MPGEDGQGWGWGGKPPTIRATEARGASGGDKGMTRGSRTAAPPSLQRGTSVDGYSVGTLHRHLDGADGTRAENGMQSFRGYVLLAPAGDPDVAGNQVRGDGHGDTRGTDNQG